MNKRFKTVSLVLLLAGIYGGVAFAETSPIDVIETVQQNGTAVGTVVDASGNPLTGASVVVKGTTKGTMVDNDGRFSLAGVKKGQILRLTFIGYKSTEVQWNGTPLNITLEEDQTNLDEVIVVGYGTTTKRDLIASVSTVKTEELENLPVANMTQGLAGRSPGLIVTQSGGGVNTKSTISIRGGGDPIYVIDGVVRDAADFQNLSSDDIQSMSILKDASATAIYGSRATNGIVQVVTKHGKQSERPVFEYDFNQSWSQPSTWPQKLDSYTRAEWANVARANDGLDAAYSQEAINAMKNGTDLLNYSNTNWRDLVLNNWAPTQKHTVRVTGGNDVNRYYASLGHVDQESLYKSGNHYMKRTTFRLADDVNFQPIGLEVHLGLDGYYQKQVHPYTSTANSYYHVFSHINDKSPLLPGVNSQGLPYAIDDNPVAETADDAGYARTHNYMMNGKGEIVWNCLWVDGLRVRLASDYRYQATNVKNWRHNALQYEWDDTAGHYTASPYLYQSSVTSKAYTNQAFLEYGNTFGKHTVSALGGFEQYYEKQESFWASRENYEFDTDQMDVGPSSSMKNGGSDAELGRAAWIFQAKYNYANKYYIEGSLRRDGSDYFADGHRWGNFFGGSLGWVVTEENFMKGLVDRHIFDNLKIRASYGETGQDNSAGRFAYLTSYTLNTQGYVIDGKLASTFTEGAQASPDLTWYTTRQTDLGFDWASARNRFYGSFDYFYYSTKGYLVSPTGDSYVNTMLGVTAPKVKSDSEYRRAGYELNLGWRDQVREFKYDLNFNFTWYNTAWALNQSEAESAYMNPYQRTQQTLQNYYGLLYHNLGYYTSAQDVYAAAGYLNAYNSGNLTAGDIRYEDTNGDGRITAEDQRRLGKSSTPHGQFGFNVKLSWKGWYFTALFQGSCRFDMYLQQNSQTGALPVVYDWQTDVWTADNTDAKLPRLTSNQGLNSSNNTQSSDFWLINGAYLRMKDFTFGYDFKYSLLKNVNWLSRAKVGISGQNIFTISDATKYGLDPENSSTLNYGYPVERTIAFSINLGF